MSEFPSFSQLIWLGTWDGTALEFSALAVADGQSFSGGEKIPGGTGPVGTWDNFQRWDNFTIENLSRHKAYQAKDLQRTLRWDGTSSLIMGMQLSPSRSF
jgi:hypothetical protein